MRNVFITLYLKKKCTIVIDQHHVKVLLYFLFSITCYQLTTTGAGHIQLLVGRDLKCNISVWCRLKNLKMLQTGFEREVIETDELQQNEQVINVLPDHNRWLFVLVWFRPLSSSIPCYPEMGNKAAYHIDILNKPSVSVLQNTTTILCTVCV